MNTLDTTGDIVEFQHVVEGGVFRLGVEMYIKTSLISTEDHRQRMYHFNCVRLQDGAHVFVGAVQEVVSLKYAVLVGDRRVLGV